MFFSRRSKRLEMHLLNSKLLNDSRHQVHHIQKYINTAFLDALKNQFPYFIIDLSKYNSELRIYHLKELQKKFPKVGYLSVQTLKIMKYTDCILEKCHHEDTRSYIENSGTKTAIKLKKRNVNKCTADVYIVVITKDFVKQMERYPYYMDYDYVYA